MVGVTYRRLFLPYMRYVIGCAHTMMNGIHFARMLRAQSTDAERKLWGRLRGQQILGVKFRRQAPIGRYIVDFVSLSLRIIIELDGGQHAVFPQHQRDAARDRWFEEQGFLVLRFWNTDVLLNMDGVLSRVLDAIHQRNSS